MRLFNHDVNLKAGSRWPISYFRIQRKGYPGLKFAIRWWMFSFTIDQSFLELVLICAECDSAEIGGVSAGEDDFLTVCQSCRATEGDTYYITEEEYEARA